MSIRSSRSKSPDIFALCDQTVGFRDQVANNRLVDLNAAIEKIQNERRDVLACLSKYPDAPGTRASVAPFENRGGEICEKLKERSELLGLNMNIVYGPGFGALPDFADLVKFIELTQKLKGKENKATKNHNIALLEDLIENIMGAFNVIIGQIDMGVPERKSGSSTKGDYLKMLRQIPDGFSCGEFSIFGFDHDYPFVLRNRDHSLVFKSQPFEQVDVVPNCKINWDQFQGSSKSAESGEPYALKDVIYDFTF